MKTSVKRKLRPREVSLSCIWGRGVNLRKHRSKFRTSESQPKFTSSNKTEDCTLFLLQDSFLYIRGVEITIFRSYFLILHSRKGTRDPKPF